MFPAFTRISGVIDRFTTSLGNAVSFLAVGLVILTAYIVFERYILGISTVALTELNWHFAALLFLLGSAYTLKSDHHVRVDLIYHGLSVRGKAWVNLLGASLFLLPLCILVIWVSLFSPSLEQSFVFRSWRVGESSPDPGGLPAFFLLKTFIPISFFVLLLQGISEIIKSANQLFNHSVDESQI
jgi:TRAP-type mannitol/chloroaromatic compound transport system permease small subunit